MSATPRPWKKDERAEQLKGPQGQRIVVWDCGLSFGQRTEETQANAELIVRAVNSFDDLLAACKEALADMEDYEAHEQLEVFSVKESLAAAISKAEAKP